MSRSNPTTGKIMDGPDIEFRCYAAMLEAIYPPTRASRWENFDILKSCKSLLELVAVIQNSIARKLFFDTIRLHVSGDFYSELYFQAWLIIAITHPKIKIYGYTKRCDLLIKYKNQFPPNFVMVASYGGRLDNLIEKHDLVYSKVVHTIDEATALGLPIDSDDSLAMEGKQSFALLIHGAQPKLTTASTAAYQNRKKKRLTKNPK